MKRNSNHIAKTASISPPIPDTVQLVQPNRNVIRLVFRTAWIVVLAFGFGHDNVCAQTKCKPNIVVILADDMGYGDLNCTGSKQLLTPHLDELAKQGVLCTRAYVTSSVCSPSRAGLMTGRDPRRFGYQANLNKGSDKYPTRPEFQGLPRGEHTLGDQLLSAGYATALIGKWHLGSVKQFHPNERGFEHFLGMLSGSHNYFPNSKNSRLEVNGQRLTRFNGQYLTDYFTDEALRWIDQQQKEDKPWFAFLSYNAPHTPMQATEEDVSRFAHISNQKRRSYAAMMFALDRSVGRIRDFLESTGELENTLFVFFSDNGGATNNASWNGSFSGAKGCLKEGGIRVPMIWSWPGTLPTGIEYSGVVSSLDLLPTFMAAAQSKPLELSGPANYEDRRNRQRAVDKYGHYDGVNLLPILSTKDTLLNRKLFFRLQGQAALLVGDEKLIRLSHRPAQFFDVESDSAEENDISAAHPDRVVELFRELGEWEASLRTVPLWGSSPYWAGNSAKIYDNLKARPELELSKE